MPADRWELRREGRILGDERGASLEIVGEPGRERDPEEPPGTIGSSFPLLRDVNVPDRVLDDQIPADDPGDHLAECHIRVGVGAPGDRHHRRDLGVAERGEAAGDRRDRVREHDRGPRAEGLVGAGDHVGDAREESRADDRADAEHREIEGAEAPLQSAVLPVRNDLVDRLPAEDVLDQRALVSLGLVLTTPPAFGLPIMPARPPARRCGGGSRVAGGAGRARS